MCVCGPVVVSHVITNQYCVSGHEAERPPQAELSLLPEAPSAVRPKLEPRSF